MTRRRSLCPAALTLGAAVLTLATALPAQADARATPKVHPRAETPTLYNDKDGGKANADDPAIWRDPKNPARSLVIGTAKKGGLRVYDLDAREVQSIPAPERDDDDNKRGRFNNVDLVHGMRLSSGRADLAVVSDRGNDRLRIYRIDRDNSDGPLVDVTDPDAQPVFSADQDEINEQRTAYGLATWSDARTGRSYAVVSRRHRTDVALLELTAGKDGTVGYRTVRTVKLPSSFRLPNGRSWTPCAGPDELPQVEGMVVDPANGTLYAGQEDVGIWRMRADLTGEPVLIDKVREYGVPGTYDEDSEKCTPGDDPGYGGKHLAADVEGLTLVNKPNGEGYLLASSQGDSTFVAYDRKPANDNRYLRKFRVAASSKVDGSEECDGAAALHEPLGDKYPQGLLVVQDGHDTPADDDREATNFKFVDLRDVLKVVSG
ncbi:phytase [Streptoalloteichus hindustanus]|uniref:3-phytase n=1 Tax=Streptoalloteichus hindustanus TaxID=2017 RepID=A0A1M5EZ40_STRHI|nr:phytase [Streptoalloteichus hindustanus]SHF84580.1 3-phytase [Streptoalloteichus hindustanus]